MKKKWFLLFILIHHIFVAHPDFIKSYEIINKNKIIVKANQEFSQQFIKEDFFVEYDKDIDLTKLDESVILIPFILNVVPIVWLSNKTYAIEVMDKDLYYSLQKINEVFRIFYPKHQWQGKLIPKKLVANTINSSDTLDGPILGLLFSGGLDSIEASLSYGAHKQLLITAWGADVKIKEDMKWQTVNKQVEQFTQEHGHTYTLVKSNFREFAETSYLYNKFPRWWVRASFGLSFIGLTAPLLVHHTIPTLLIASSHTVHYPYPLGSHPAIDSNLSFAGRTVHLTSGDKDRVQKIKNIASVCKKKKLALPWLRVCWSDSKGGNCLRCEKCLRSCVNIIASGQLPEEYGFTIDIKEVTKRLSAVFSKKKKWYLPVTHIHLWDCNRMHLNDLCKKESDKIFTKKEELEVLRDYLNSIDLTRYRNPRTHVYSLQEKELFTNLWHQHMKNDNDILNALRPSN